MIIIIPPNSTPMVRGLNAVRQEAPLINVSTVNELSIICDCSCVYRTTVFGLVGGSEFENDKSDFIFRTILAGDSVVIELHKEGVLLATISDDTYGEFFPLGSITQQPLYVGFLVEWEKVLDLEGPGTYEIVADVTVLGNTTTCTSEPFQLLPFTREAADGTVRIDAVCNSNVESSEFNFIGINWFKSKRIYGQFGYLEPTFETKNYFDQSRVVRKIQDAIVNEYTLETTLLTGDISNKIIYEQLLGDVLTITDYNIITDRPYVGVQVYPDEIERPIPGEEVWRFKFTDKQPNHISRLFIA